MFFLSTAPFLIALLISAFSIPVIIKVADLKHLMDEPDSQRKFHAKKTPTLGGVAIFAGTLFSFSSFSDYLGAPEIQFMIPALVLLFFSGIKDDILVLSPFKKLVIQFTCATLITVLGNLRLTNLWGMFGITTITPFTGSIITILLIVALINAFNLIDGIDGLAGGLGLITSLFLGTWFLVTGHSTQTILAFSLAGSLVGFLYFNINSAKIFMGDTGSMVIGFIISALTIKFIEGNRVPGIEATPYYIKAAPGVAFAAVLIPLFDMTRVCLLRLLKGKSPFTADRLHIHHVLQDMGMSHIQISLSLHLTAILFLFVALFFSSLRSLDLTFILLGVATILLGFCLSLKRKAPNKRMSPMAHVVKE